MIRIARRVHHFPRTLSSTKGRFKSTHTTGMEPSQPFEEERLPWYSADQFYPVRIGEMFESKYKVVGKLGYGAYSTVWLCRNVQYAILPRLLLHNTDHSNRDAGFVAVKVCTREAIRSPRTDRELKFYEHVSSLNSQHDGQAYIRGLFETFKINGPTGEHLCLVQPPMHMTIRGLQYHNASRRVNTQILKWTLYNILSALSFLHDEAEVIHTGELVVTVSLGLLADNLS
jgi:serine/threonine protein kinase